MPPRLSARLEATLALVQPCEALADIGTDHALIPLAAVHRDITRRAIGVDLNAAPLRLAQRNLQRAGLQARVTLIQGDGLHALPDTPIDAITIAGLTGPTMVHLCRTAPEVLARIDQLIIQPTRDLHRVRAWARENGWHLRAETMIHEGGRYFAACAFHKGLGPDPAYAIAGWTPTELCMLGPHLLTRQDPTARGWCEEQHTRIQHWANTGVGTLAAEATFWHRACAAFAGVGR